MKVLLIYNHLNPKSFNNAVLESFKKGLSEGGHSFEIIDLHALNFEPRTQPQDLGQFARQPMPQDVLDQQKIISSVDAMVFIYPTIGLGFPAMMKGWIDRVFSFGFAYVSSKEGNQGLLNHQKVLLISTTGWPEEFYDETGAKTAIKTINTTLFNALGIKNVEATSFYDVYVVGDEVRKKYLETAYRLGKEF
jgi:NAD(P)H dehydrogenase (quinone)